MIIDLVSQFLEFV